MFTDWTGVPVTLAHGEAVYDVDGVDDILATAEVDWIADHVSAPPCGPETLPQFTGTFASGDDVEGRVTLVAYFTDAVILIVEAELKGDWGLAFATTASLMRR